MAIVEGIPGFTQFPRLNLTDDLRIKGVPVSTGGSSARSNYQLVKTASDFPTPVGGVITLANDFDYEINGIIDISPNRIVLNGSNVLYGQNPALDAIVSDVAQPIVSGNDINFQLDKLTLENPSGSSLDLTGVSGSSVFISNCVFNNISDFAIVNSMPLFRIRSCAIRSTPNGLQFTGTENVAEISGNLYVADSDGTAIDIGSATFNVFNLQGNYISIDPGVTVTFLNGLANNGNLTTEGQGTVVNNVSYGGGTAQLTGIDFNDEKWNFVGNNTVPDSTNTGSITMTSNATATTITAANTPVKVAGTTTLQSDARFDMPQDNRVRYQGRKAINAAITYSVSGFRSSGGSVRLFRYIIYKNGSPLTGATQALEIDNRERNCSIIATDVAVNGDFYELWVENEDNDNNITVTELSAILRG